MEKCFHCGLPADDSLTVSIEGKPRYFCCHGCMAVAQAIHEGGLEGYYRFRDQPAERPASETEDYCGYDLPEVQAEFVSTDSDGLKTARLSVQGISCAACAWLIEHHLQTCDAVDSVRVNATNRTCLLRWDDNRQSLSSLLDQFRQIGYRPQPDRLEEGQRLRRRESQQALMRLGVAGIGMMQVGMVAVALYAGGLQGIERNWEVFLRWVSLVIATPVVLFSAQPFFNSAWRALRSRHLNMDVPVSLAIGLAYSASVWATLTHTGEVYFDSVSMFTFFLLLGRFLEMRARHSSAFASANLRHLLPLTATRVEGDRHEAIPLAALESGDRVWVDAGATIPADGQLLSAVARVDESLLTGESALQDKRTGDLLIAGTLNSDTGLLMAVAATGTQTQLAAIEQMVATAALEKPHQVALADRLAVWFVAAVLCIATLVAVAWWWLDPDKAFWVVLSVLVVTCPCALSLAIPAALTAGVNRARRLGVLISGNSAMETLASITTVVFDKTGTLTEGRLRVSQVVPLVSGLERERLLDVLAALERHSRHPIAQAFSERRNLPGADHVMVVPGAGIEGRVDGSCYRFGRADFALERQLDPPEATGLWQLISLQTETGYVPLAWVCLTDNLRNTAGAAVDQLRQANIGVALLSGDRFEPVESLAKQLHIEECIAQAHPEDKLQWLQKQQRAGRCVLMVGDGINDVPVLSAADVSMAMGSATRLAQSKADSVLLNGNLVAVAEVIALSARVQRIIRQNLAWALLYNAIALPAAVAGWVPPWLAAIGMSLSSLIVVLNAMRV